jgi:hypothetical protein
LRSLYELTVVFPSRTSAVIPVVIAGVVGVLLLAVVLTAIVLVVRWRSERHASARHFPLIVPTYSANTWQPEPFEAEVPVSRPPLVADVHGAKAGRDAEADEPASTETIRFERPTEQVLQLLPGRLEVLAGETRHREIRFVRAPGQLPQLILGRDAVGSPQHVTLQSSTVSRQHARLAYSNGRWAVANLSQTNPVIVNDEELSGADDERALVDGDRIELGEVVLRFHAH